MLQEQDGVGIENGGQQQTLRVHRIGRHDHLQARDMREPGMHTLRMRRTLAPATAQDQANDDGDRPLTAEHKMPFGGIVDELVHGEEEEIQALMNGDGAHAAQGRTHRNASHGRFGSGNVEHAVVAVFFSQACRRAENALRIVDAEAIADQMRIKLHRDIQTVANGIDESQGGGVCVRHRRSQRVWRLAATALSARTQKPPGPQWRSLCANARARRR